MATNIQRFKAPTSSGKWVKASSQSATTTVASKDTIFVVLATGPSLAAAGVDIKTIRTKVFGDFVEMTASGAGEGVDVKTRELLSHVRLAAIEPRMLLSAENLRIQTAHFSVALEALGKMTPEKLFETVEQLETAGTELARDDQNGIYQTLSAQEMADRMQCSLPVIYQRESADEFFSALAPGRKNGKRYPVFLLSDKLVRIPEIVNADSGRS